MEETLSCVLTADAAFYFISAYLALAVMLLSVRFRPGIAYIEIQTQYILSITALMLRNRDRKGQLHEIPVFPGVYTVPVTV